MRGAATIIDIEAIGLIADRDYVCAEFMKYVPGDVISRAVGSIDDDPQPAQIEARRKCAFAKLDVAPSSIVDAARPAQVRGRPAFEWTVKFRFDGALDAVRELRTVTGEKLYAVVIKRIM